MYGAKSKYVRKYARKGRSKVGALAKGKSSQIRTLAKAVSNIQRSMRVKCEYLNYRQYGSPGVSGDYYALNLCDYLNMDRIFGTAADDDTDNRVIHKSIGMDMYLTLENTVNEPDSTQFTIFLVTLKDIIGSAFDSSTGALTLTAGIHYVITGGQVLLNKKLFRIHKIKRTVLTNHGTSLANPSAQTQGGSDWRGYWKFSPNTMITNAISTSNWKGLRSGIDPSKTHYLLVFNNNSTVDLQNPVFQFNVVHTMKTVA